VNLENLFCDHNQLTSLDLMNNIAIMYLSCDKTVNATGYNKETVNVHFS
jgi:hypothetical protein